MLRNFDQINKMYINIIIDCTLKYTHWYTTTNCIQYIIKMFYDSWNVNFKLKFGSLVSFD